MCIMAEDQQAGQVVVVKKKPRYMQRYRLEWEKEVEFKGWLMRGKDDYTARCLYCQKELCFQSGRKNHLRAHAQTPGHMSATECRTSTGGISQYLCDTTVANGIMASEIMFVNFLVEYNISFNTADHFTELVKSMFPDSKIAKGFKCGRTKTTCILKNAIAPSAREPVIANLSSELFSIIVDESTDRGDDKQMAVIVKYYDNQQLKTVSKFYRLRVVNFAMGENLFKAIEDMFKADNLKFEYVIGFGTDGAASMIGRRNSVLSRLNDKQPHLFCLHCVCHVSHTCASDACKKLPDYLDTFFVELFWHFHRSAKRTEVLREFQEFTETALHKILKPCSTRWLQLEACVTGPLSSGMLWKDTFGIINRLTSKFMSTY